jgi:signal transduction histidine kinase
MKNIKLEFTSGDTLTRFGISSLLTDHVRLGQVITNLVSNAIRFTASSPRRSITVTYDVALSEPVPGTCGLPSVEDADVQTPEKGGPVWLFVSVKDSGPGLSPEELQRLFLRFSRKYPNPHTLTLPEASDMIHSQYGGSGLGLYICKSTSYT